MKINVFSPSWCIATEGRTVWLGLQSCYIYTILFSTYSHRYNIYYVFVFSSRTIFGIGNSEGDLSIRVYLDENLRLVLDNNRRDIWHPSWQVPAEQWTFVALQVNELNTFIVFNIRVLWAIIIHINGQLLV